VLMHFTPRAAGYADHDPEAQQGVHLKQRLLWGCEVERRWLLLAPSCWELGLWLTPPQPPRCPHPAGIGTGRDAQCILTGMTALYYLTWFI
jgi:hypothetical protein